VPIGTKVYGGRCPGRRGGERAVQEACPMAAGSILLSRTQASRVVSCNYGLYRGRVAAGVCSTCAPRISGP
jgi:hypothetical protein